MLDSWILDVLDVQLSEVVISSYIMLYHVIYIPFLGNWDTHWLVKEPKNQGLFFKNLFAPTNRESTAHVGIHRKDEGIRLVQLLSAGFLRNLRFQWEVSWGETGGNMTWRNAVSCLLKVLNCFSLSLFFQLVRNGTSRNCFLAPNTSHKLADSISNGFGSKQTGKLYGKWATHDLHTRGCRGLPRICFFSFFSPSPWDSTKN